MLAEYLGTYGRTVQDGHGLQCHSLWHLTTVTDLLDLESLYQGPLISRYSGIEQRFLGTL